MNKLNNIFSSIYVITYDESPRLNNIKTNLIDLDYKLFMGCNKKNLNTDDLYKQGYTRANKIRKGIYMTEGVFACAFSHLWLYQKLKRENTYNNILILEDDALLIKENIDYVIDCYNNLPDDWDVFFIGYNGIHLPINYKNMFKGGKYKMGDRRLLIPEATHAYAINNNFLEIILEKQENPKTFGGAEFWDLFYKLNYFACVKKCFLPDKTSSVIGVR